jgi:Fe-S cluster assembly iron-binding protein IscA
MITISEKATNKLKETIEKKGNGWIRLMIKGVG